VQPSTSDYTQHIPGTMYPPQMQPLCTGLPQFYVGPMSGTGLFVPSAMDQCAATAGQCAQWTSPHWPNCPNTPEARPSSLPNDTGTQDVYDGEEDLPHKPGHAHCPHRLFHGFFDTYPDSRHGPARPIRSVRTPCSHPTSAADKPTHPANHRTASPLWRSPHPSITMPRARAHQPSDRGTPCIPAPRPTIAIRPARPSGFVGPAVRPPFCV